MGDAAPRPLGVGGGAPAVPSCPAAQDAQRNLWFAIYEACGIGFRGRTSLIAPIEALGRAHLRRQVRDQSCGCSYAPLPVRLQAPDPLEHVLPGAHRGERRVVTEPIARVDEGAVISADGARHEVDTIITAIGYRYSRSLLVERMVGAGGRTLGEVWNRSPRAYLGSAVPGFPNMFILLGPNSIGINSVIFSLESQIAYVMSALRDDGAPGRYADRGPRRGARGLRHRGRPPQRGQRLDRRRLQGLLHRRATAGTSRSTPASPRATGADPPPRRVRLPSGEADPRPHGAQRGIGCRPRGGPPLPARGLPTVYRP